MINKIAHNSENINIMNIKVSRILNITQHKYTYKYTYQVYFIIKNNKFKKDQQFIKNNILIIWLNLHHSILLIFIIN